MTKNLTQQNIPSGWKEVPIGKHIKLQGGNAFSAANYVQDGIPLVRIGNVGKGDFVANDFVYISKDEHASNESVHLRENDILMGMTGELGKVARIGKKHLPAILNQRVGRVVFKDKDLDPDFTFQVFLSKEFISKLEKYFIGAAQKNISSSQVESIEILLPPIKEQHRIAEILGVADEDIAKTQEVIEATEKLKRGLMQQLFTRGIGHKKFKETKIGQIPEEWEIVALSDVATVERGKFSHRPRNAPEFYGGNIPFIQTGDVVNSNGKISFYTQTLNEKGLSVSKLFKRGTIVITIAANIGDTGILQFDSCFPDSLIGITPSEKIDSIFLEYYLRTKKEYLNSISTQSAQKNINLEKLNPLPIVLPAKDEQKKIAEILSSVDGKVSVNIRYRETLTRLKKGLMQDLLSGKIRVNK